MPDYEIMLRLRPLTPPTPPPRPVTFALPKELRVFQPDSFAVRPGSTGRAVSSLVGGAPRVG